MDAVLLLMMMIVMLLLMRLIVVSPLGYIYQSSGSTLARHQSIVPGVAWVDTGLAGRVAIRGWREQHWHSWGTKREELRGVMSMGTVCITYLLRLRLSVFQLRGSRILCRSHVLIENTDDFTLVVVEQRQTIDFLPQYFNVVGQCV